MSPSGPSPIALTKAVTDLDPAVARRAFDAMVGMKKIDLAAIEAARRGWIDDFGAGSKETKIG